MTTNIVLKKADLREETQATMNIIINGLGVSETDPEMSGKYTTLVATLPTLLKNLDEAKDLKAANEAKVAIFQKAANVLGEKYTVSKNNNLERTLNEHCCKTQIGPKTQEVLKKIIIPFGLHTKSDFAFQLTFLLKKLEGSVNEEQVQKAITNIQKEARKQNVNNFEKFTGENIASFLDQLLMKHLAFLPLNEKVDNALRLLNNTTLTEVDRAKIRSVLTELKRPGETAHNASIDKTIDLLDVIDFENAGLTNLTKANMTIISTAIGKLRP